MTIDEVKRLYAYLQHSDPRYSIAGETVALAKLRKMLGLDRISVTTNELLFAAEAVIEGRARLTSDDSMQGCRESDNGQAVS